MNILEKLTKMEYIRTNENETYAYAANCIGKIKFDRQIILIPNTTYTKQRI